MTELVTQQHNARSKHAAVVMLIAAMLITAMNAAPLAAQIQPGLEDDVVSDPRQMQRVEASVDRALEYLLRNQNADGSWPSGIGKNNGINAICLLAYMGRGHAPRRGPFRPAIDRGVAFILATQNKQGLYQSPNPTHGPMYEHALATLAVIEAYGFIPSLDMRRSAQRAVDLIVKAQTNFGPAPGGWRYQPYPGDADLSVTVMQIVALRAAINARLNVPKATTENALKYVKACVVPEGGFAYQPGGVPGPARTAAGCLSMQLLGAFDDPAVEKGLQYLQAQSYDPNMEHFHYMNYYAMQAHFQAGGAHWARWHPKVRQFLLQRQNEDGSWPGFSEQQFNGSTNCYSTAMGAVCLEVYMHYLPAYQR